MNTIISVGTIDIIADILMNGSMLLLVLLFGYYICLVVDSYSIKKRKKRKLENKDKR